MNVFILSTGRCGSTTFAKACKHITNFSSAHESRIGKIGQKRLDYPDNHIESDNRITWLLGRLQEKYGDSAVYVHLLRDPEKVADSFLKRYTLKDSIIVAYSQSILLGGVKRGNPIDICRDYVYTVNSNIEAFLADKTKKMRFDLENSKSDFVEFWDLIGAVGDFQAALSEFDVQHNASLIRKRKNISI